MSDFVLSHMASCRAKPCVPDLISESTINSEDNDSVVNAGTSVLGQMETALDSQHVKKRCFRKISHCVLAMWNWWIVASTVHPVDLFIALSNFDNMLHFVERGKVKSGDVGPAIAK